MTTDVRQVLLTSAASGVGRAVQEAARLSSHNYQITGMNSVAATLLDGTPTLPSPATAAAGFLNRVEKVLDELGPSLVIPGRDEDAAVLAEFSAHLAAVGGNLATGPAPAVAAAYDKATTNHIFGPFGLPVVPTANDYVSALSLASAYGWPLVVKPRWGNASHGVHIVSDRASLYAHLRPGHDVAQVFLPGYERDRRPWDGQWPDGRDGEYSIQIMLSRNSRPVGYFASRNTLVNGIPSLIHTVDAKELGEVLDQSFRSLAAVSAWGIWNVQGLRSADGPIHVFEVNPRPTGLTGVRAGLGFNELDAMYDELMLGQTPKSLMSPPGGLLIDVVSGVTVDVIARRSSTG